MTYTGVVFRIQENSAFSGVDFSLKLGFTKIVLTPSLPLVPIEKRKKTKI